MIFSVGPSELIVNEITPPPVGTGGYSHIALSEHINVLDSTLPES